MSLELISLEEFYTDIYPTVPGCPEMTIENAIRAAAILFCANTGIAQFDMDPITVVAGQPEYDFETPDELVVHTIVSASHDGNPLDVLSPRLVEQRFPRHRKYEGAPKGILRKTSDTFFLYPTPHDTQANSLYITVAVKPATGSEFVPQILLDDHKEAIVAGTLARLLMIPKKDWTDPGTAGVHAAAFERGMTDAKRRARRADEGATPRTSYGGIKPNAYPSRRRGWR